MLKDKLTAILFIGITIGLMIGMFVYEDNRPIDDFLAEYRNTVVEGTPVLERITGAIDAAEVIMIRDTYRRSDFNELFGVFQKILGKNILQDPAYGEIYRTSENQITYSVEETEVEFAVTRMTELKNELEKQGIPLLYVQAPFKVASDGGSLPANKTDYADINANRFLEGLQQNKVDYLDLRTYLRNGEKSQKELFFDTDHHWRTETAFDATWHLAREMNRTYGFHIQDSFMSLESYKVVTYKDFFQGSMGRRVGIQYGGLDDFTYIQPDFPTNLTVEQHDKNYDAVVTGDFSESMIVRDNLNPAKPVDTNRYAVYRGDNAELVFKNNLLAQDRLILIKDSFALPVYSFLAPAIKETRALDMRYFDGNVVEYAKENKPQLVVVLYNGDCFNEEMFDFNIN